LFIPVYVLNFIFSRYVLTYLLILPFANHLGPVLSLIGGGIRETVSTPFNVWIFPLLTFLILQSILMVIVMSFKKNHALVYLITILVILIVYNILMIPLMSDFGNIPKGTTFSPGILFPHFNLGFGFNGNGRSGYISEYFYFIKTIRNLNNLIWLVICFFLYLTASYKFREREI